MMFGSNPNQQQQSLRNRNGLPGGPQEPDFMAAAAEADQRRFQQFGYNSGSTRGLAGPGMAQSSGPTSNNNSRQNIQSNYSQQQIHDSSATSLHQAKSILSQVLTNIGQDPSQGQLVNQPHPSNQPGIRHSDFMPLQQQTNNWIDNGAMSASAADQTSSQRRQTFNPAEFIAEQQKLQQMQQHQQMVQGVNRGANLGVNGTQSQNGYNGHQQLSFGQPYVEQASSNNHIGQTGKSNATGFKKTDSDYNTSIRSHMSNQMAVSGRATESSHASVMAQQNRDQTWSVATNMHPQQQQFQTTDDQQSQDDSRLKEQFFESLGLPGDLNNLQDYNFKSLPQQMQQQALLLHQQQQQQRQDQKSPSTRAPAAAGGTESQSSPNKKEILTLTIEIGEGRSENILICEGDDPYQLAQQFDARHQIGDQLRDLLAEQIRQNIQQVQIEQMEKQQNDELSHIEGPVGGAQDATQTDMQQLFSSEMMQNQPTEYDSHKVNNLLIPVGDHTAVGDAATFRDENMSLNGQIRGLDEESSQVAQSDALGYGTFQPEQIRSATQVKPTHQAQQQDGAQYLNVPFSQNYKSWQAEMNERLRNGGATSEIQQKPLISQGSRQIMEHKKNLAGAAGSGFFDRPVHERLHKAAVAKQQQQQQLRNQRSQSQRGPSSNQSFEQERADKMNLSNRGVPNNRFLKSANRKPPVPHTTNIVQHASAQSLNSQGIVDSPAKGGQVPPAGTNYGERLYRRGLKKREEKENLLRQARSEQLRAELDQYTFQPETNNRRKGIHETRDAPTEELLINYGKRRDEVLNFQRALKAHQEAEEHDFQPKINRKSAKIMRNRSQILEQVSGRSDCSRKSASKFESLYQDAVRRNERQMNIYSACLDAECTFQPDREKTKFAKRRFSSGEQDSRQDRSAIFDRLSQCGLNSSRERSQMMLANSNTLTNDLYDPETGQQLFHPQVGRGPQQRRPAPGKGTYDHLYKDGQVSTFKKLSRQVESETKKNADANQVFTASSSQKIMEKKKFQAFSQIFTWLDSDKDGHISADKIDISLLSADLLEVLSPLFMEMEELSQALDSEEFIDAVGRLYDSVALPQKNILLLKPDRRERSLSNRRKHDPGHQFQPQINQKSKKLAGRKLQAGATGKNVTERLYEHAKAKQMQSYTGASDSNSATQHLLMQQQSPSSMGMINMNMNNNNLMGGTFNSHSNQSHHLLQHHQTHNPHLQHLAQKQSPSTYNNVNNSQQNQQNLNPNHYNLLGNHHHQQQQRNSVGLDSPSLSGQHHNSSTATAGNHPPIQHNIQMFNSSLPASNQYSNIMQQQPAATSSSHQLQSYNDEDQNVDGEAFSSDQTSQQHQMLQHMNMPLQQTSNTGAGQQQQQQDLMDNNSASGGNDVDLNNLAHLIAKEMLQKHLNQQQTTVGSGANSSHQNLQLPNNQTTIPAQMTNNQNSTSNQSQAQSNYGTMNHGQGGHSLAQSSEMPTQYLQQMITSQPDDETNDPSSHQQQFINQNQKSINMPLLQQNQQNMTQAHQQMMYQQQQQHQSNQSQASSQAVGANYHHQQQQQPQYNLRFDRVNN